MKAESGERRPERWSPEERFEIRDFRFQRATPEVDRRPFWRRLLGSLRLKIKPGKSLRRPVNEVWIEGGTDF